MLFNLVHNAIRHTPADGSITVRARMPADRAVAEIEVADTGPGIAPTHSEAVFEPFHRGDDARTGDGAGLGLAISRAIVEAHGGTIWIEPAQRRDAGSVHRAGRRLTAAAAGDGLGQGAPDASAPPAGGESHRWPPSGDR